MARKKSRGISRRDFVKGAGAGALAGLGPTFLFPERAWAQPKSSENHPVEPFHSRL